MFGLPALPLSLIHILIATNPVDIMTHVTQKLTGFDSSHVFGSGTTLDTARLRYLLGDYFGIDPRNVHAYVMGEHGDSEFVPWSQALITTKPILTICQEESERFRYEDLERISEEVRHAAQRISEAKKATYYGIGMSLARITRAVFGNENSVLTTSVMMRGEYGEEDVYVGVPSIIHRDGVKSIIRLSLGEDELEVFHNSCSFLRETYREMGI